MRFVFLLVAVSVSAQTVSLPKQAGTDLKINQSSTSGARLIVGAATAPSLCGPPLYSCSSQSTTAYTLSFPWTTATLYNSTTFGPLNPSHDCITRLTDQNLTNAYQYSAGNFTYSGGSSDIMVSLNTTYLGAKNVVGTNLFKLNTSGACIQNASPQPNGQDPGITGIPGAFGFSRVADAVFYNVFQNHILSQNTITSSTTYTTTSNANFPFDFDNCPGPVGTGAPASGSILGIGVADGNFVENASWIGGQGTGRMVFEYKPGIGCTSIDYMFGNWYAYCASNCGGQAVTAATLGTGNATFTMSFGCSYTAGQIIAVDQPMRALSNTAWDPYMGNWRVTTGCGGTTQWTGTPITQALPSSSSTAGWTAFVPSGQETVCTNNPYATSGGAHEGIHDTQSTLDGQILGTSGACWNQLGASSITYWQANSGNVIGSGAGMSVPNTPPLGGGLQTTGHTAYGYSHVVYTSTPSPNYRGLEDVSGNLSATAVASWTQIAALGSLGGGVVDMHGWWPYLGTSDNNPWILGSISNNNWTTPVYLQNEIFGVFTNDGISTPVRFSPTYNSGTVSASTQFSCHYAISIGSQDGKWEFWIADGNLNLGIDSTGKPLCSIFAMKLE